MIIYVDANLSHFVADALNSLNKGYFPDVEVVSTVTKFGANALDEEWLPKIEKCCCITKDINIHRTRLQYELCQQYKIGMVFVKLPSGQDSHWHIVRVLIKHWEEIMQYSLKHTPPFSLRLSQKGITPM